MYVYYYVFYGLQKKKVFFTKFRTASYRSVRPILRGWEKNVLLFSKHLSRRTIYIVTTLSIHTAANVVLAVCIPVVVFYGR